ncbi:hypothetical protein J6590_057086 [Homalodisca vitripennis]|nr:hypothetical protein J6590_057086 [Homalodisca vitripennis]
MAKLEQQNQLYQHELAITSQRAELLASQLDHTNLELAQLQRKIREYNPMLPPAPVSKKITSGNVKHKFIKSAVVGTACESGVRQAGLHGNNSMLNPVSVNSTVLSSVSAVCGVEEPSDYDTREPEKGIV